MLRYSKCIINEKNETHFFKHTYVYQYKIINTVMNLKAMYLVLCSNIFKFVYYMWKNIWNVNITYVFTYV